MPVHPMVLLHSYLPLSRHRCSTNQHPLYGGIAWPARSLDVGLLRPDGASLVHRTMPAAPAPLRKALAPDRAGRVVAVACLLPWSWLADLGAPAGLAWGLGQARSLHALHGGTATNAPSAAHTMAVWLRGGRRPQASGSPAQLRATRALLRRRTPLRRQRAERGAPVHTPTRQDTRPEIGQQSASQAHRPGGAERCAAPAGHKRLAGDLPLLPHDAQRRTALERAIGQAATPQEAPTR
jgi:hypothetical protein